MFSLPTFCYRFLFHDVYLIESVQKHAGLPNTSFPAQNDEQLQGKVCTSVRKAVYEEVRDTFQMKHTMQAAGFRCRNEKRVRESAEEPSPVLQHAR